MKVIVVDRKGFEDLAQKIRTANFRSLAGNPEFKTVSIRESFPAGHTLERLDNYESMKNRVRSDMDMVCDNLSEGHSVLVIGGLVALEKVCTSSEEKESFIFDDTYCRGRISAIPGAELILMSEAPSQEVFSRICEMFSIPQEAIA